MSSTPRTILVVGATGKQGRAFVFAALSTPSQDFRILALTRNANSPSAKSLASAPSERLKVIQADLDQPASVKKIFEDAKASDWGAIWGVFVVLAFPGLGADATAEENQGKLCADLALEYGVHHLVYSSVERGGEDHDDSYTLDRRAKVLIERHIKSREGLRWTILRPAFFMENFDGAIGRITTTVLRVGLKRDTKLQLIAADDIGTVAFAVFQNSEASASKAITVMGDALTSQEIADSYRRGASKSLPSIPDFVGRALLSMNKHTKDLIADIERVHAARTAANLPEGETYAGLITECRALHPGMQTMEAWARGRGTRKDRAARWNNVTVGELVQGKR